MVEAGRFVDGWKAAGVEFFVGCTFPARPAPAAPRTFPARHSFARVMHRSGLGQGENGIISNLNMSGEMHMRRRSEVFGCIPHGRGAWCERIVV